MKTNSTSAGRGKLVRQASRDRKSTKELLGVKPVSIKKEGDAADEARPKTSEPARVRIWWPPTRDKKKTGYSGAYWEAAVLKKRGSHYEVEYDNGDTETVDDEHVFPADVPVGFGGDTDPPIQVGEFVEASNGSATDPCAWLGVVSAKQGNSFEVSYPFHDSPPDVFKPSLIRRARVWENKAWRYIQTGQTWSPGEVTSPKELFLLRGQDYFKELKQEAGPSSKKAGSKTKQPKEGTEQKPRKRREDKEEKPKQQRKQVKQEPEDEEEAEQAEQEKQARAEQQEPQQSASKRKPGRSRKPEVKRREPSPAPAAESSQGRKRGRPPKAKTTDEPPASRRRAEAAAKAAPSMGTQLGLAVPGGLGIAAPLLLLPGAPSMLPTGLPVTLPKGVAGASPPELPVTLPKGVAGISLPGLPSMVPADAAQLAAVLQAFAQRAALIRTLPALQPVAQAATASQSIAALQPPAAQPTGAVQAPLPTPTAAWQAPTAMSAAVGAPASVPAAAVVAPLVKSGAAVQAALASSGSTTQLPAAASCAAVGAPAAQPASAAVAPVTLSGAAVAAPTALPAGVMQPAVTLSAGTMQAQLAMVPAALQVPLVSPVASMQVAKQPSPLAVMPPTPQLPAAAARAGAAAAPLQPPARMPAALAAAPGAGVAGVPAGTGRAAGVGSLPGTLLLQPVRQQLQQSSLAHGQGPAGTRVAPGLATATSQVDRPAVCQLTSQAKHQQPESVPLDKLFLPLKHKKRKRDRNAPKKPTTAYVVYCNERRAQVIAENPGMNHMQVTKLLAAMWAHANDKEKARAVAVANADKERYQQEMASYIPPSDHDDDYDAEDAEPSTKRKPSPEPDAPKKPRTAYAQFSADYHRSLPHGTSVPAAARQVGDAWAALGKAGKEAYKQQAEAHKQEYDKDQASYLACKAAQPPPRPTAAAALTMVAPAALQGSLTAEQQRPSSQPALAAALASADLQALLPTPVPLSLPVLAALPQQQQQQQQQQAPAAAEPAIDVQALLPFLPAHQQQQQMGQARAGGPSGAMPLSGLEQPAHVRSGLTPAAPTSDDAVLSSLNMAEAKQLLAVTYKPHAYLMLVDALRPDSPRYRQAVRAVQMYVHGQSMPDWHACLVGIFGLQEVAGLVV